MILLSEKNILYTLKMEIDETDGNEWYIYIVLKSYEIQEVLIAERVKRNEPSIKYKTEELILFV